MNPLKSYKKQMSAIYLYKPALTFVIMCCQSENGQQPRGALQADGQKTAQHQNLERRNLADGVDKREHIDQYLPNGRRMKALLGRI